MDISFKTFNELTTDELYAVLQLRSEVFVVEQNCVYQDIDYKDQKAIHLLVFSNNLLTGYLRIFKKGDYFKRVTIGRVVIKEKVRSQGLGHEIIKAAIAFINEQMKEKKIKLSAQSYLKKFYESHGFIQRGEEYLEDNIPHIAMYKE